MMGGAASLVCLLAAALPCRILRQNPSPDAFCFETSPQIGVMSRSPQDSGPDGKIAQLQPNMGI